ncbi:MAG: type VI secretion system tip protein VgrG [Polyangiales bacterium]
MAADLSLVDTSIEVDGKGYRLVACTLREALSEVPAAHVELAANGVDQPLPEASEVIGKPAELTMTRSDGGGSRTFVGVVIEAERFRRTDMAHASLRLTIAPRLWNLGRRADCRSFHNLSAPDILGKVLTDAGATDKRLALTGTHPSRKYTVQYRETDLEFLQRVCAEEGIYFKVDHADGKDTVVLGDAPDGLDDVAVGPKLLPFVHTTGFAAPADHVTKLRQVSRVRPTKAMVRDYDFEKPKLKLEATEQAGDDAKTDLEVYDYPARAPDVAGAKRLGKVLLETLRADRRVVEGEATAISLHPGLRFEVSDHPYAPLNVEYVVTAVTTEVRAERHADSDVSTANQTVVRFTAIPTAGHALRGPRRAVARTCPGLQTAWTTGASGQEIYVDKHGRVKVQFHWDREGHNDDKSSDWIRTWQQPTTGAMYLPRVGWEVSVVFAEGDVDRPYVMQRWYNGQNVTPYKLPDHKARGSIQTATTPGGGTSNEIRMDDTKGKEEMFLNGSRDMSIDVGNNTTESVGNNETHSIGSNHKLNVTNSHTGKVGADQSVTVGANQTLNVQTFYVDDVAGSHTKTIGGMRNMKIGGDHRKTVAGDSSLTVGAMQVDLVVGSCSESTPAAFKNVIGAAAVDICVGDRSVIVGGMRTETVGAAKIVVTKGGRGVEVKGVMSQMVGGAIINKVKGDKADNAGAAFTEIAAGASIIKADNVTYEAESMLTLVMGGSIVMVTPASVMIIGASCKLDGATVETAALVLDN